MKFHKPMHGALASRQAVRLSASKRLGRLGWNFVERCALKTNECKPIEILEDLDTGIDGLLEFVECDGTTKLIALQVKCGSSYFDRSGARVQTDAPHLRSWMGYPLPVLLVVVREDESQAYWMDISGHIRANPSIVDEGPYVLRPPTSQVFDERSLNLDVRELARMSGFDDVVFSLCHESATTRLDGLSLLYRFRMKRPAPFALAAAIRMEREPFVMAHFCDFYSRYLGHPETTFGAGTALCEYARMLLSDLTRAQLLAVLASFTDDEFGDWSGAEEFFNCEEEQIWDGHSIIERGTVQQGIAEVLRISASPAELLSVAADPDVPLSERKTAIGVFGYLGDSCSPEAIDQIWNQDGLDAPFCALLAWLRYWMVKEEEEVVVGGGGGGGGGGQHG